MTFSDAALRSAFSRYATGVTVVSCCPVSGGQPIGITVNSFTSVSLAPPMVLWCIDKGSSVFRAYMDATHYAVSVLRHDQRDVSDRFAKPSHHDFQDGEYDLGITATPLLKKRLAGFECAVTARHAAGDHVILVGEVIQFDSNNGHPLLYMGGQYGQGVDISR